MKMFKTTYLCMCFCLVNCESDQSKPNIVLFIADDLGWNDVGFHGSNVIPTPNIDALAYSGLALHNYYVTPICTPSRAALMTGKYPIHTGMQHGVIYGAEPRGLPLSEKILPQYLKEQGYKTHLVGKWHLGHYKKEYLPLYRGFDSHTGFWTGRIDMYDHTSMEKGSWGFDFRRGFQVAHDLFGQYATDVYTKEAVKVIQGHNKTAPLFLVVAHSAVHSGNPGEPIRAPDDVIDKFKHIKNYQRQKFAAVVSKLDESIGTVVDALHAQRLLQNSIILFSTDNGGAAAGFNDNAASNYPLKGVKNTLWEGGLRGAGLLWSPLLRDKCRLATQRLHIVDWLPTLLAAAGYNTSELNIDGINQWDALSTNAKSRRTTLVHNIDDIWNTASITINQWKLIKGASSYNGSWDHWFGPAEREGSYDVAAVYASQAAGALHALGLMPDKTRALQIREAATVQCNQSSDVTSSSTSRLEEPYLYNIEADPCEYTNLAIQEPEVLRWLERELARVNETAVAPNTAPSDPRGDPKYWGRVYTNFGDYQTNSAPCL